jgi:hypothetical protein
VTSRARGPAGHAAAWDWPGVRGGAYTSVLVNGVATVDDGAGEVSGELRR